MPVMYRPNGRSGTIGHLARFRRKIRNGKGVEGFPVQCRRIFPVGQRLLLWGARPERREKIRGTGFMPVGIRADHLFPKERDSRWI